MLQTGYRPLRKLRDDLGAIFGIAPSHQAIQNWLSVTEEKRIQGASSHSSGYYCYDEQHIELAGRKRYRLTLFDTILNAPVAEEIAVDCGYQTVYENYYRQTDPESTKKRYEKSRGILSYLAQKMAYWSVKFGRLPQPPTS